MSHKYEGEATAESGEDHRPTPAPQRSRQANGTTPTEPVRRSWRPCQMLNQDGEMNHHHHHHHPPPPHHHHHHHTPTGRGPQRHRRRPPPGQNQAQGAESRDPAELRPIHPRPGVARYRRHGDPNPRVRGHRQRQPIREVEESSEREAEVQQSSPEDTTTDDSQTPVAVVSPVTPPDDEEPQPKHEAQQERVQPTQEEEEEEEEGKNAERLEQAEEDEQASLETVGDGAEQVEEDQEEEVTDDVVENSAAQESEITDLCSDTESVASLSMDGPLHSPPPLHSPTPPSSPDAPHFPQLDHFSEDMSTSPPPDNDMLPEEDEDEEEDCYQPASRSESYPKTYADFYSESHQKSYSEPKTHPNSFPEPLKTSYPEREPRRQSGWSSGPKVENVPKEAPNSHHASRHARDRGSHPLPPDHSIGCRLHHYDGQSDGEGAGPDCSPIPKSRKQASRRAEAPAKSPSSGQSSSGEAPDDRSAGEDGGTKGSGDAISLAIKGIKEAIEEVKTKTVRSPYTPDQPVEPIWVMRQEVSPTEDGYPPQTAAAQSSPQSPSQLASESPSRYSSAPVRETVSPARAESSRAFHQQPPQHKQLPHPHPHQGHQVKPREASKQTYAQPQPYGHAPPSQHQQRPPQHQHHQHHQHHQPHQPPAPVQPQSPQQPSAQEIRRSLPPFPTFVDVPGPCDPEDLIDGIIFAATYLGCTHLLSERTPSKSARMQQAQEAMSRVRAAQKQAKNRKKSPDSEVPSTAEVDLFMSTQRIKVLNADTQESLMDLPLRTISYIADIGNMVVLMARGKMVRSRSAQENLDHGPEQTTMTHDDRRLYRMICHVFESEDAQLIAQSIGQSFSVAYQEFLRANGIDPEDLSQREYSDLLNTQDMYNDDLIHFSKSENCRDVYIEKQKGEILGVVIVESGWGSILPTVIIASMMHAGPAEKSGRLNIGDQIMTINGTSLVGLPLSTCQSIIKGLKSQSRIKMNIVRCPPVTMVLIRRPDLRYQLGFSVQNGIICSLMRGGIAERGGVRVGHRIIEINSQSVVATPHEKIVQILSNAMGEIHMKTMPAAMYRLLTAQEQPVYI